MPNLKHLRQITLGELIKILESLPPETSVPYLTSPHSYRGFYSHLAFEFYNETTTAKDLLKICKNCLGDCFDGYKGGEYFMGEDTPLWISEYGKTGAMLVNFNVEDNEFTSASGVFS